MFFPETTDVTVLHFQNTRLEITSTMSQAQCEESEACYVSNVTDDN